MLRQVEINAEKSFIGAWFIDTKLCDDLVQYFESNPNIRPGRVNLAKQQDTIDKNIKDSIDLSMDISVPIVRAYNEQLELVINEYKKLYPACDDTCEWKVSAANLQKYNPGGGFFIWHAERVTAKQPDASRHLVFMTYLNDVTDGGETEFFHQQVKVKPQKGLTLIWPADWTHSHRGVTSPTQTKYIVTGWYNFIN